jgi:hypothetical protein
MILKSFAVTPYAPRDSAFAFVIFLIELGCQVVPLHEVPHALKHRDFVDKGDQGVPTGV